MRTILKLFVAFGLALLALKAMAEPSILGGWTAELSEAGRQGLPLGILLAYGLAMLWLGAFGRGAADAKKAEAAVLTEVRRVQGQVETLLAREEVNLAPLTRQVNLVAGHTEKLGGAFATFQAEALASREDNLADTLAALDQLRVDPNAVMANTAVLQGLAPHLTAALDVLRTLNERASAGDVEQAAATLRALQELPNVAAEQVAPKLALLDAVKVAPKEKVKLTLEERKALIENVIREVTDESPYDDGDASDFADFFTAVKEEFKQQAKGEGWDALDWRGRKDLFTWAHEVLELQWPGDIDDIDDDEWKQTKQWMRDTVANAYAG